MEMDSANTSKEEICELLQANDQVYNDMLTFVKPMAPKCALHLGIFDAIHSHGKPLCLAEMGPVLSIHPEKTQFLLHVVRILTHMGYFSEHDRGDGINAYALTTLSKILLKDHPSTARHLVLVALDPRMMDPYHYLSGWLQGDEQGAPFSMANGMAFWESTVHEPEFNHNFNQAMANDSKIVGNVFVAKSEEWKGLFEGASSLVDVAGGTGEIAKAITKAYPHINCIVLDLPHVVQGLQGTNNLTYVAGDMFAAVPSADVALLKCILHDWDDEDSLKILKQCKKAITRISNEGPGKLIIIDVVLDDEHDKDSELRETQLFFDVQMVAMVKGKERTESEWEKLIEGAGFKGGYKIHPGLGMRSIIEVYP